MGKTLADHVSDEGLVIRVYKQVLQPNNKITQFKMGKKDLNGHFFKEDIQTANKHMKMFNVFSH